MEASEHLGEAGHSGGPLAEQVTAIERLLGSSFAENATLRREVERLQAQVDTRDLLQQAQGIIMGRLDVSADTALGLLTGGAGSDDAKLRLLAAAVVAARRTPAEVVADVLPDATELNPTPPLEF
jgi:AmiR/NasT family two-component response regulator